MIAVDTNLLVYAHRRDSQWHAPARNAIRSLAEGASPWAIPWPCLLEFLAITTHRRIYSPPSSVEQALHQVQVWLAAPSVVLLREGDDYWQVLSKIVAQSQVDGPRIHDARIAAMCIEHGIRELWTADRNFSRFPDVPARNPLLG